MLGRGWFAFAMIDVVVYHDIAGQDDIVSQKGAD